MLHSFNAAGPTELALQDENRQLKADAHRMEIQLLHARAEAASTKQAYVETREELQGTAMANAALRRGCMVRDLRAMSTEYMQKQAMIGYACYQRRSSELVEEVTSMHDSMINDGVTSHRQFLSTSSAPLQIAVGCRSR